MSATCDVQKLAIELLCYLRDKICVTIWC